MNKTESIVTITVSLDEAKALRDFFNDGALTGMICTSRRSDFDMERVALLTHVWEACKNGINEAYEAIAEAAINGVEVSE